MEIEQLSFLQFPREPGKQDKDLFLIKILEVSGETAVVSARGMICRVRTQIPLAPGQYFFVKQEQKDGNQTTWRIVQEILEPPLLGSLPETRNCAIFSVLHNAGLPISEKNFLLVQEILSKLGNSSPVSLLIAATLVKLALSPHPLLLESLASFLNKAIPQVYLEPKKTQKAEQNAREQKLFGFRLKAAVDQLRGILLSLLEHLEKSLESEHYKQYQHPLKLEGESAKQLLGGQIFAWAQENSLNQTPFFYIPLFLFLDQNPSLKGEISIYSSPQEETPKSSVWSFLISLETPSLGWVQVELTFKNPNLYARALVEQKKTKVLFDECWPYLADSLRNLNFYLHWLGCAVGTVRTVFAKLRKEHFPAAPVINLLV